MQPYTSRFVGVGVCKGGVWYCVPNCPSINANAFQLPSVVQYLANVIECWQMQRIYFGTKIWAGSIFSNVTSEDLRLRVVIKSDLKPSKHCASAAARVKHGARTDQQELCVESL